MKRVKGYVVAYDNKSGELVWTVKVKDPNSLHNAQKFSVASLHPGTMLTKPGIDVTFRVQDFGSEQEKVLKAVDVSAGLKDPDSQPIKEKVAGPLMLAITESEGKYLTWLREETTAEEAKEGCVADGDVGDAFVGLIEITPELVLAHGGMISDEEAAAGLATVRQMARINPIRDVLCAIAAEAFLLGQRQVKTNKTQN